MYAGRTSASHRTGRTDNAGALSTRLPGSALRASGPGRASCTSRTDYHPAFGAHRTSRALHARGAGNTIKVWPSGAALATMVLRLRGATQRYRHECPE